MNNWPQHLKVSKEEAIAESLGRYHCLRPSAILVWAQTRKIDLGDTLAVNALYRAHTSAFLLDVLNGTEVSFTWEGRRLAE